jgi:nucleotide-binding universal stress UspA family protein
MIDPPYRTVAVASAFSPRFLQVLAEGKRMRDRLASELHLIYVGKCDEETTRRFGSALRQLNLPSDSTIHYHEGDPASAILEAARANEIDLIVAGALEKEAVLRQFLGNVARRLVREATCSVMLFTKPESDPKPLSRIVLMAEYSDHGRQALRKALRLAALEQCERLYVIRVYTTFDEARAKARKKSAPTQGQARTLEEEEVALEQFIDSVGATDVPIEARCIRGNTSYAVLDFVQSVEALLLVVPVAPQTSSSGLPAHVAWVTDVIPCNLWVIR